MQAIDYSHNVRKHTMLPLFDGCPRDAVGAHAVTILTIPPCTTAIVAAAGPRVSMTRIAVPALFLLATRAPLLRRRLAAAPGLDAGEVALEP